jgi:three-Cys-motif partner protein
MSSKKSTVWEAAPHTIAKIAMLKKYLFVWFSIFGSKFSGKDLWYVDGFSGPGEYTNHPHGSPIAALQAAEDALEKAGRWAAGRIRLVC